MRSLSKRPIEKIDSEKDLSQTSAAPSFDRKVRVGARKCIPPEIRDILTGQLCNNPYPDADTYKAWSAELTQKCGFEVSVKKLRKCADDFRNKLQKGRVEIPTSLKKPGRPSQGILSARSSLFATHNPRLFGEMDAAAAPEISQEVPQVTITDVRQQSCQVIDAGTIVQAPQSAPKRVKIPAPPSLLGLYSLFSLSQHSTFTPHESGKYTP
ncbi:hypothetical protein [Legionella adelaidensis]|nr:hypothetical protein [Legionella adelaidensis]